ncbi:thiazole synthase [bacterium]
MLKIADREFQSRLFVGTGKFSSNALMSQAVEASGTEMVTVALRRVDFNNKVYDNIVDSIPKNIQLLPNTSGAKNAKEAVRIAKVCRASLGTNWIKLEVISDNIFLLPDPVETLKASEILVKDGFVVLPYMGADPVLAKKLEHVGTSAVMPLGSPIGTNRGLQTIEMIKIIIEMSNIPVVVDAGIGSPSHAALAMELGADAVLINTAIASAENPTQMAKAFKYAVASGRMAYESGLGEISDSARASSPLTGFLD